VSDAPGSSAGKRAYLVTGAAGFIGSHLCDRLLAEGHRVVGVDDLSTGRIANLAEARTYGKDFTFENFDIRADGMMALFERHQPEVVMHLAAQSSVSTSIKDPMFDADVNVLGTLNVLECAGATGTRKMVFATSGGTIYGEQRRFPIKETALAGARPLTPYAVGKKMAGDYLHLYQRFRGVDCTSLALGNVYGPRQDPMGEAGVIAIFAGKMLSGEAPMVNGDGNQTRDYIFISDAVDAFARAADRSFGRMINVATGLETSVNHLYRMLAEIIGFAGDPEFGPLPPGDLRRVALDIGLADRELGWRPWTHLEDGLAETVAYLKGI
jgi:UDP-glucose 4-epimerase